MHIAKKPSVFDRYKSYRMPGLFVAGFALVGVGLLLATHAATPVNNAIEPESGTISGGAVSGVDSNASNTGYIAFQAAAIGGGSNNVTGGTDTSCQFQKADKPTRIAFCEGFNSDFSSANAANRSGGLYNPVWGISRNNTTVNLGQGQLADYYSAHLEGCGATHLVFPTKDVQVCNGRMQEAVYDGGHDDPIYGRAGQPTNGLTELAIYPKQPFDFKGRTGTVVFDVSADSAGPHQAWPEFWITDKPVPTPGDSRSSWNTYARNSFGFAISSACNANGTTGIDHIAMTTNYAVTTPSFDQPSGVCPIKTATSKTGPLNHFELRINSTSFEIWAGDPGATTLKLIASGNVPMPLTKGLIWLEDIHYNACKFGVNEGTLEQCDHDFAWDNVGFDGPATYRDLAFDVTDANINKDVNTVQLGYEVGTSPLNTFQVNGVYRLKTPDSGLVTFSWLPTKTTVPSFSLNGGAWHDTAWPYPETLTYAWRTIDIAIPESEIKDGTNTIQFKNAENTVISNIDLILVNGSPLPASLQ